MTSASTSTAQPWPPSANVSLLSQAPSSTSSTLPPLPQWSSIFSSRSSTLHHVPKGARDAWAGLVYDVFSNINRDPSVTESWLKLFMLPRCILTNPTNGAHQTWRETLKVVRARLGKWQSGDISGLWSDLMAAEKISQHRRGPKKPLHPDALCASNVRRAKRAIEAGQYRKGIQALTSDGLAPASSETLGEMLAKHPQSPLPSIPSSPPPSPITINEAVVAKALRSFPGDSAPGPSLFRANHFKEAVFCPSPDRGNKALRAVMTTVNHLCAGRPPPPPRGNPPPLWCHSACLPEKGWWKSFHCSGRGPATSDIKVSLSLSPRGCFSCPYTSAARCGCEGWLRSYRSLCLPHLGR